MVEIKAPRYRDRKVLIGAWKWSRGYDMPIRILTGSYAGDYIVPNKALAEAEMESFTSKNGKLIRMLAVSLDDLQKKGGDDE